MVRTAKMRSPVPKFMFKIRSFVDFHCYFSEKFFSYSIEFRVKKSEFRVVKIEYGVIKVEYRIIKSEYRAIKSEYRAIKVEYRVIKSEYDQYYFAGWQIFFLFGPVKIISLILSRANHKVGENWRSSRKTT